MRFSEKEAKAILGDKAYKKAKSQMRPINQKALSSMTDAEKESKRVKQRLKREKEQIIEDRLVNLFKRVFEPDYTVSVQQNLVPGRKFSVDVYVSDLRLAGELDGWMNHGFNKEGFKRDRIKDRLLMLEGVEVVRFFASEIEKVRTPEQEAAVIEEIKLIRKAREAALGI